MQRRIAILVMLFEGTWERSNQSQDDWLGSTWCLHQRNVQRSVASYVLILGGIRPSNNQI